MTPVRLNVPAAFAAALLTDLRVAPYDDERDSITDPKQLAYEARIDASVDLWLTELDGEGDRTLIVPNDRTREWLDDYLHGAMLEGLTGRLVDGSTSERKAVVAALDGWADVMAQLEPIWR
jgi:hypothetical protein